MHHQGQGGVGIRFHSLMKNSSRRTKFTVMYFMATAANLIIKLNLAFLFTRDFFHLLFNYFFTSFSATFFLLYCATKLSFHFYFRFPLRGSPPRTDVEYTMSTVLDVSRTGVVGGKLTNRWKSEFIRKRLISGWACGCRFESSSIMHHDWAWKDCFFAMQIFVQLIKRIILLIHIHSYGAWRFISLIPIISNFHSEHIISGRDPKSSPTALNKPVHSTIFIFKWRKKDISTGEMYNGIAGISKRDF